MQERVRLRERYADLLGHRERLYLEFGLLQGPGVVMDVAAVDFAPPARAVEAIALGQEVLERPRAGVVGIPHRPVTAREPRFGRAPVRADAPVAHPVARYAA